MAEVDPNPVPAPEEDKTPSIPKPRGNEPLPVLKPLPTERKRRVPTTHDVVFNGVIIGTDSDPEMRKMMLEDAEKGAKSK